MLLRCRPLVKRRCAVSAHEVFGRRARRVSRLHERALRAAIHAGEFTIERRANRERACALRPGRAKCAGESRSKIHGRRGSRIAAYPPMPVRAHPGAVHESCGMPAKRGSREGMGHGGRRAPCSQPGPMRPTRLGRLGLSCMISTRYVLDCAEAAPGLTG